MPPTRKDIVAACDEYIAAVSAGDPERVMALYGPNPTVEDPVGSEPHIGRDAVEAFYQGSIGTGVKLDCRRLGAVTVTGSHAAFQFRVEVDLGETKLVMATTDVMTFDDDGLVAAMTAYADPEANPDDGS
jgi:steroid delta-isomerase